MGEFELIRHYFQRAGANPPGVVLGVGDDCALLAPEPGQRLAISTDMLVEGRHFFADVDPIALGHKALAVNLSDLAAMGASPLGCTLALALPRADAAWLAGFSRGLSAGRRRHHQGPAEPLHHGIRPGAAGPGTAAQRRARRRRGLGQRPAW